MAKINNKTTDDSHKALLRNLSKNDKSSSNASKGLIASLLLASCSPLMYIEEYGLQTDGRRKTELSDYEFEVRGDTIVKTKLSSKYSLFYDKHGRPTEIWHWGKNQNKPVIKEMFKYDDQKHTITYESVRKDTILEFYTVYSFNRKRQPTGKTRYEKGLKTSYQVNVFEPNRRDFITYSYDETNTLKDKFLTQKNKKGQTTRQASYNTDGSIKNYSNILYYSNGLEKEHIWYQADGKIWFGSKDIKYSRSGQQTYSVNATDSTIQSALVQRFGDSIRTVYFSDKKATAIEEAIISYK
ncbi:hypothetical protein SAMN02927903_00392 [Flavobacterium caeni]|uniref:YD repeat-containing protein n=2 Tax=Flavobacterium caeni TaxID=490189 RepID=A0A1G5BJK7_9FLAO|nr:hypothetical protein SAMN02927903_00392 [Flavobacterium caeni]